MDGGRGSERAYNMSKAVYFPYRRLVLGFVIVFIFAALILWKCPRQEGLRETSVSVRPFEHHNVDSFRHLRKARNAVRPPEGLPLCTVHVEDILGGDIEGADLVVGGKNVGSTDSEGDWTFVEYSTLMPIFVSGYGYATVKVMVSCPGTTNTFLSPENNISGKVVIKDDGRPVADVIVSAGKYWAKSAGEGIFTLRSLPPGAYQITGRGAHWYGTAQVPITLGIGSMVTGVEVEVLPAFTISGQITADSGEPMSDLRVRCCGTQVSTNEGGEFTIPGVLPGEYPLKIRGKSIPAKTSLFHEELEVAIVDRDIDLDIILRPRLSLNIEIIGPEGEGVSSVEVEVAQRHKDTTVSSSCTSDSAGRCMVSGLHKGSVEVRALLPRPETRRIELPARDIVRIEVGHVIRELGGRVLDSDGEPVEGRMVVARAISTELGGAVAKTDPHGAFHFAHLAPERYTVEVHPGAVVSAAAAVTREVDLSTSDSNSIEIILESLTREIRGHVFSSGHGVDSAVVTYTIDRGGSTCWGRFTPEQHVTMTNSDGAFVFDGVSEGTALTLAARGPQGELAFLPGFDPGAQDVAQLNLVPVGFVELRRSVAFRRERCWVFVRTGDGCTVSFGRWPRGHERLKIDNLPTHMGRLDVEMQCKSSTLHSEVLVHPGEGAELFLSR